MATTWCVSVKDEYGETIAADEWITGGAPRNPELAAAHRVSMVHLPDDSSHRHMAPNPTDQGLSDIEDELDSLNLGATDRAVDASGRQRIDDSIAMRQGGAPTGSRLAMLRSPRSGGPNNENVSAVLDRIQSEGCLCSDKDDHLCPHGGPVGVNLAFMERPSPPPDPNARYSPCPGYEGDDAMH
eukprot:TRINITY_DN6609_c0_g1_i2.p3 TRINITY_DN6609_c0_g1~~TRINITY_DN6609_c0_g1_i2.p3  ORF type:complete len:184 (-),score=43.24 TRINITY_DN6609_c0_g1_i2:20-571(-)